MSLAEARLRAAAAIAEKLTAQSSLEAGAREGVAFALELGASRAEVFGRDRPLTARAEGGDGAPIGVAAVEGPALSRQRSMSDGLVVLPLVVGDDLEGVLAVRGALDASSLDALSLVASTLGLFFARRRLDSAESELRKNQTEQKIIFDSVPAMIWFKDRENRILRCNRMAAQAGGVTPEVMEGRSTEEFYPDEAAQYLEDDLEVIHSGQPKLGIVEPHSTGAGNEKIWVRTDKIPYRDESGAVTGVVVFATDITQLKRAEEALRAEKERLLVTLSSIADAVIATDEGGKIAIMNPVAEKLTGWMLGEARGLPIDTVVRTQPDGPRGTLFSRSGTKRSVTESRAPIKDDAHVVGEVIVLHDVTETLRLEQELFKVAKMESIGLLAAGIAHDFNNILTAVAANASLARASLPPGSSTLPLLDEVDRAMKQARELTLQLLTFAKGGAPARERVNVADPVRENASFSLRGSNARLVAHFAKDLDAVDLDKGQFAQVIQNLVINAKQSMPQGGVVSIRGENVELDGARARALRVTPGRFVKIAVEDTGAGIDRENLAKIFDPFFTTKPGGTGLGLTTTFSIVRRHEGAITCDSRLGLGTTFEIFLPASRTAASAKAPVARPAHPEEFRTHGRALIMDDQKTVRDVLGRMLEHLGLHPVFATNGEEAIRIYEDGLVTGRRFDLVFMDLTVPGGMGGRDAVQRILKLDPDAHVIVSSGYSNDPVMADHESYGFRGLLAKPFALEDVVQIVSRFMSQSRARSSG